ncbi:megakaryocyte and platelet inhibitory receptor G6b isoform X4 [Ochotona curzoniae]|uniref:megakaryocyte and platelet inhibitory receptor G6b isoform X4 n=1 Tax=Ochotona curzoniae TaxID=130825 RepID=UPI001B346EE1|nr:megakaryocyte and platelet inhibitory receptor G6b isoform X4 [Ochotona curzoniae]
MALVLQLLVLLLSRVQGDPGASLQGRPGEKVNLSCTGVSHPVRWAWAPSFPACKGLSKGRRKILWVSTSGTPTVPPLQPFAGRLRALDPGIRRLELLLSTGDSGTFFCKGRNEDESHTVLHVLGDRANCRTQEPTHGAHPRTRLDHSPVLFCPLHIAPLAKVEPQSPVKEEEEKEPPNRSGDLEQEPSLLYAELDPTVLRRPRRLSTVGPGDASTVYAVVV